MTLKGKLFKSYAEELIKKDKFGTTKMMGFPQYWLDLEKEYEQNEELVTQKLEERIDKEIAEGKAFSYMTEAEYREWYRKNFHWVGVCEAIKVATEMLDEALTWLIKNEYMRRWSKKVGKVTYTYYGLTSKGWAVANKYLGREE